jgi:hypothetical protein
MAAPDGLEGRQGWRVNHGGGRDNPPEMLNLVPIWCQKMAPFRAFCCSALPLVASKGKAREG